MRANLYPYKGSRYTLNQLAEMFPDIKKSVIESRLRRGLSVEEATACRNWENLIPEQYRSRELVISFDAHPPVFQEFLPVLHKHYLAIPHEERRGKIFYTVNISKDKELIVYPGEFRVHGLAKRTNRQLVEHVNQGLSISA